MSNLYRTIITEASYKDNFEEGEVLGSFSLIECDTATVTDIEKAIKDFAERYGDESGEVYVDDDFIHMDFTLATGENGWRKPSKKEIELWKQGKIDLFNVEYAMCIYEMRSVEGDELEKLVGALKKQD